MARKSRRIKRKASTSRRKSGNLRLLFFVLAVVLGIILLAKMFNPTGKISQSGSDVLSSASLVEQSIWQYQTSGTWKYVEGSGTRIAVGPDGNPWVVNSRNEIWKRVNDAWQIVNGEASDISVGANGAVWIVGKNGEISKLNSDGSWEKVDGAATTIAVGPNGQPWVVNSAGQIWKRVNNKWVNVKGAAKDIAIGPDGNVWVIGINSDIWRWSGTTWSKVVGAGERIAVGNGEIWVVNSGGQIWQLKGNNKWKLIPGAASDVAIGGNNSVWVLGNSTGPSPTSPPTGCTPVNFSHTTLDGNTTVTIEGAWWLSVKSSPQYTSIDFDTKKLISYLHYVAIPSATISVYTADYPGAPLCDTYSF